MHFIHLGPNHYSARTNKQTDEKKIYVKKREWPLEYRTAATLLHYLNTLPISGHWTKRLKRRFTWNGISGDEPYDINVNNLNKFQWTFCHCPFVVFSVDCCRCTIFTWTLIKQPRSSQFFPFRLHAAMASFRIEQISARCVSQADSFLLLWNLVVGHNVIQRTSAATIELLSAHNLLSNYTMRMNEKSNAEYESNVWLGNKSLCVHWRWSATQTPTTHALNQPRQGISENWW